MNLPLHIEILEPRIAPATFVVTSLADNGAAGTLRDAVQKANALVGRDTITFAPELAGTIALASGEIDIAEALIVAGPGAKKITVDAGNKTRIFMIEHARQLNLPTIISGLTLTRGASADDGGALLSFETTFLDKVVITKSHARGDGGGAAILTDGEAKVTNSSFAGNRADGDGGGLVLQGSESTVVRKTGFALNTAKHRGGGLALHLTADAQVNALVDASTFAKNSAGTAGGGLELVNTSAQKLIVVRGGVIRDNAATGKDSGGGGIEAASGKILLSSVVVRANHSADQGGGIASTADLLTLNGCRLGSNFTTDSTGAGGGALHARGAHLVQIIASIVSGNSTPAKGGGLFLGDGISAFIFNSTVAANFADQGGPQITKTKTATLKFKGLTLRLPTPR